MTELKEQIKSELKKQGQNDELIKLCEDIFSWYEEGGSPHIKKELIAIISKSETNVNKLKRELREKIPKAIKKKLKKK